MIVYQCLALILVLPVLIALSSIPFRLQQFSKMDINNPRAQADKLTGIGERIVYAQKNAWEALIIFLTAIFIASANNVPADSISLACIVYVVARILHVIFYALNNGIMRFISFIVGFASALYIVIQAIF